jgi:hypothetical protein
VDTQYFLFNLLALGFFLGTLAFNLDQGFPDIPDLLVGLTSVSAAAYVAKKATDRGEPKLTSVAPAKAPVGTKVDVWGRNLLFGKDTASPPSVTVGGKVSPAVEVVSAGRANADRLRITIPELEPGDATIVVTPDGGKPTEPLDFEVERTIQVQKVSPERLKAGSHAPITIFGSGLKGEGGTSAELGGVPLTPADEEKWTDRRLTFTLDPNAAYPTNESADLIVSRNGEVSETKQFFLEP